MNTDIEKAKELLPWYVKSELSAEENTFIEKQLASSTELQAELALVKKQVSLTEQYVDGLETEPFENQASRLNALKNRMKHQKIEQEQTAAVENKNEVKGEKTMWSKLLSLIPQTQSQWKMASAVALSIMVIQGVVITQLASVKPDVEYTTLSGTDGPNSPDNNVVLLAGFKEDTSMSQMETFLKNNRMRIIDGPREENQYKLGFYQINKDNKVPNEEEVAELVFDLMDSPIIDFVLREE